MERLTEKTVGCFEYALKDHKAVPGEFGTYDAFFDYSMAVKRLGHYEDTGLDPEEIADFMKRWERAVEIAGLCKKGGIDHLLELKKAEQDGRLVVLPSKTVYELTWDAGPGCDLTCPISTDGIGLCDFCDNGKLFVYERPCTQERLKELGKTVFLTREEAEAALKGGDG